MSTSSGRLLGVVAVLLTTACVVIAAGLMARTPDAVLGSGVESVVVPGATEAQIPYQVPEGANAAIIAADLETLGVIRSARQFESLARLMGVHNLLSAGDHLFRPGMSTPTVIRQLLVPDAVPVRSVTFPEGIRIEEMAIRAEDAGFGTRDEFLAAAQAAVLPPGIAASLPDPGTLPDGQRLQGYLFPDTYILPESASMADLIALMISTLNDRITVEIRVAIEAQGLTIHEALTLASIVEREAVIEEERPLIAGVFFNRILASDLIGADPTVQYAVSLDPASVQEFGYWKRELTQVDLQTQSPYNTRLVPGIPPGPITNPGLDAIEAVAFPADTDYYYFVANAVTADGRHEFAVTEAEHIANIAQYGTAP